MNREQAIQIVRGICDSYRCTKQERVQIEMALNILTKPEKESKEEKKKDYQNQK